MIYTPGFIGDPSVMEELQRIALAIEQLRNMPSAPQRARPYDKPFDGQIAIADGTNWDPLGDGVKKPVWFDKNSATWNNFGEGTGGALVHSVQGTPDQILVNNANPQQPVLSLADAVLDALALADTALQPGEAAAIQYVQQEVADKAWSNDEFVIGHTILGVRYPGAIVRLPTNLAVRKIVQVKDELGSGFTVVPYVP